MNTLIRLKKTTPVLVIAFVLAWFALSPIAQAVVPPPDGGYPNFTTAEGTQALQSLTTGAGNTGVGWKALFADTTGNLNTAIGAGTLLLNRGDNNTATGALALLGNTTGNLNTAMGESALFGNTTGIRNTAMGKGALYSNTTGSSNTAVGYNALVSTFGLNNIGLGSNAGVAITSGINIIAIGANVDGVSVGGQLNDSCYIGNIKDAAIDGSTASVVYVDHDGKLGTTFFSSQQSKKEIGPMGQTSEAVLALKPVTFRYKHDKKDAPQFGLIAEEVAKVNPALVLPDKEGKPYSVRYDQVNAMLLNEFQKEHRKNEEQEATIARLEKQLETVTATLQKVSAQLEASKPAPQVVNNP